MRRSGKHIGFRATAALLAAFYVLACGRALVPGLCATQAALDKQQCEETAVSCCVAARQTADEDQAHISNDNQAVECSFCKLAHSLIPPVSAVTLHVQLVPEIAAPAMPATTIHPSTSWNPALPRDPPAAIA